MSNQTALPFHEITVENPLKVCFVCLGNICRSPTAEGVFQHLVNREGLSAFFEIDSAGTGAWHVGEPANSKSRNVAEQNGITLKSKARIFEYSDLEYYDLIIAMDSDNLHNLHRLDRQKKYNNKILLLREFDPVSGDKEVPDPYYGGIYGFELVFDIVMRSCEVLIEQIRPYIVNK